jgi:hypothetical protein
LLRAVAERAKCLSGLELLQVCLIGGGFGGQKQVP